MSFPNNSLVVIIMEPAKGESASLAFKAGSFTVNASFVSRRIHIRAYSELAGKLFEATISNEEMSTADKDYFDDVAGLFAMVEECVAEKRNIELSDTGELKFSYTIKLGKKSEITKYIDFSLR